MKKLMSKTMILAMTAALAVAATACQSKSNLTSEMTTEEIAVTMANPLEESSRETIEADFGIKLQEPEGASDISYTLINDDNGPIAEMTYQLDGKDFCLRLKKTDITNINTAAEAEDPAKNANISGLFYDWSYVGVDLVKDRPAVVRVSDDKAGFIGWIDAVPEVLYNLSMTEDATPEDLATYANKTFVPYDGEDASLEVELQLTKAFNKIYEAKAGSAGSSDRVSAAAESLHDFIGRYDEEVYSLERAVELTEYAMTSLQETHSDENLNANFKESFDAVIEEIGENDPNMPEMESFKCIVRAVELHMEDASK